MEVARHSSYCTHKAVEGMNSADALCFDGTHPPGMLRERGPVESTGRLRGFNRWLAPAQDTLCDALWVPRCNPRTCIFPRPFQAFWSSFLYILRD